MPRVQFEGPKSEVIYQKINLVLNGHIAKSRVGETDQKTTSQNDNLAIELKLKLWGYPKTKAGYKRVDSEGPVKVRLG